jgi:hypothetical protein
MGAEHVPRIRILPTAYPAGHSAAAECPEEEEPPAWEAPAAQISHPARAKQTRRGTGQSLCLGAKCPEAVLPDRAFYVPTFRHLLIVNKLLSLALSPTATGFPRPPPSPPNTHINQSCCLSLKIRGTPQRPAPEHGAHAIIHVLLRCTVHFLMNSQNKPTAIF